MRSREDLLYMSECSFIRVLLLLGISTARERDNRAREENGNDNVCVKDKKKLHNFILL